MPTMFGLPGVHLPPYTALPRPPVPNSIQISVVSPLYNRAPILETSLKSYLNQNFPKEAYEIILVDDASEDNTREVVKQICAKYPAYNIRCYFLEFTRCYNNIHPSNVGYRQCLGSIIQTTHMDVVLTPNVFEAGWRHLNARPNLWLNPRTYGVLRAHHQEAERLIAEGEYEKVVALSVPSSEAFRPPGYPNEFGSFINKKHIMMIHGNDERIIREPADVDQWCRLARTGVVFGEDPTVQAVHRIYTKVRPPPFDHRERMRERGVTWNPDDYVRNKDGNWGLLTERERQSVVMTESMRRHC